MFTLMFFLPPFYAAGDHKPAAVIYPRPLHHDRGRKWIAKKIREAAETASPLWATICFYMLSQHRKIHLVQRRNSYEPSYRTLRISPVPSQIQTISPTSTTAAPMTKKPVFLLHVITSFSVGIRPSPRTRSALWTARPSCRTTTPTLPPSRFGRAVSWPWPMWPSPAPPAA